MITKNSHQWIKGLFSMKGSMAREIFPRVLLCSLWSVLLVLIHIYVRPIGIPTTVHTLIGVALGLLLVFRTNTSYDRFWEGRKAWGAISGASRNLTRNLESFLPHSPEIRREIVNWIQAFSYATKSILRNEKGLGPLEKKIEPREVQAALESPNAALFCINKIGLSLQRAKEEQIITEYIQTRYDNYLQIMVESLGACERIRNTPLPYSYVSHLRRIIVVYCYTFPFALVDTFKLEWVTVVGTFFLAFVFFGIEEIGMEIEEPFGNSENDLPLESLCDSIRRSTEGLLSKSF